MTDKPNLNPNTDNEKIGSKSVVQKLDIKAARERCEKAQKELLELCDGKRFEMRVPVNDKDSDQVLMAPLRDIPLALDRIEELERERDELKGRCESAEARADYLGRAMKVCPNCGFTASPYQKAT